MNVRIRTRKNEIKPKVRFSPEYLTEIQEYVLEKSYLKAHRMVHGKRGVVDIHVPKKYIECANKLADLVMYTLKLEMAFMKAKAETEQIKKEKSNEELKVWRFIYHLFEKYKLDEDEELKDL